MAEYDLGASFIPEMDGLNTPTYSIMTGSELRNLFVSRAYSDQMITWINTDVDPNCVSTETLNSLTQTWVSQSETAYPGEGDYRVRILDDEGNRVVIGSDVTFIIESEQVAIDPCEPEVPSCPNRVVVFQICNQNAFRDDNFDIYLNGIYIGAVNLSLNEQIGSIFMASEDPLLTLVYSDFDCPIVNMQVYKFDPTFLRAENVIEMRNTQNNENGNQGTIGIRNYLSIESELSNPCTIANLDFVGSSGEDFTFNFSYTECCP